jgi:hypothetical protein
MTEIEQIRKRLEDIEKKIGKHEYNMESLKKELAAITQQIYQEVDKASKKDREELDNLIMLKNIIKSKMNRREN